MNTFHCFECRMICIAGKLCTALLTQAIMTQMASFGFQILETSRPLLSDAKEINLKFMVEVYQSKTETCGSDLPQIKHTFVLLQSTTLALYS